MKLKPILLAAAMLAFASANTTVLAVDAHHADDNAVKAGEVQEVVKREGFGILKSVNADEGKLKIAHDAIPELEWPAMTMWFPLQGALPTGIKAGDSVRFELQQENGKWVIARIEPRK